MEIPKKLTKTQRDALKKFEDTLKDDNYEPVSYTHLDVYKRQGLDTAMVLFLSV